MLRETASDDAPERSSVGVGGEGLSKQERLRKRPEYLAIQRRGKRYYTDLFIVAWGPGLYAWPRIGVTASRRVGTAVARNRAKRLVREVFRRNKQHFPRSTDIVIIVSPTLPSATYAEVERALLKWADQVERHQQDRRQLNNRQTNNQLSDKQKT